MKTKEIVRKIIEEHQKDKDAYLSKALAVLSFRPFNMKGQEIEEIVGLLIKTGLEMNFAELDPKVKVPQDKKTADIKFEYKKKTKSFDIKSYGGAERFQISTLKPILQNIRDNFANTNARQLNETEREWLIKQINTIPTDYILFFLSFVREEQIIDIHIFDIESLNISMFKDKEFSLKKVGKEKRPEIYIPISENSTLEISAGGNPYNRGMWINKIRKNEDMELIYNTKFVEKILFDSIQFKKEFDKDEYILKKAQSTIEIIKKYF